MNTFHISLSKINKFLINLIQKLKKEMKNYL